MSSYTGSFYSFLTRQLAPERHMNTEATAVPMTARAQRTGG